MLSGHPRRFLLLFCGPRAAAAAVAAVFAAVHANNLVVISGEEEGEGQELGYHLRLWPDFEVSGEGGTGCHRKNIDACIFKIIEANVIAVVGLLDKTFYWDVLFSPTISP